MSRLTKRRIDKMYLKAYYSLPKVALQRLSSEEFEYYFKKFKSNTDTKNEEITPSQTSETKCLTRKIKVRDTLTLMDDFKFNEYQ